MRWQSHELFAVQQTMHNVLVDSYRKDVLLSSFTIAQSISLNADFSRSMSADEPFLAHKQNGLAKLLIHSYLYQFRPTGIL